MEQLLECIYCQERYTNVADTVSRCSTCGAASYIVVASDSPKRIRFGEVTSMANPNKTYYVLVPVKVTVHADKIVKVDCASGAEFVADIEASALEVGYFQSKDAAIASIKPSTSGNKKEVEEETHEEEEQQQYPETD